MHQPCCFSFFLSCVKTNFFWVQIPPCLCKKTGYLCRDIVTIYNRVFGEKTGRNLVTVGSHLWDNKDLYFWQQDRISLRYLCNRLWSFHAERLLENLNKIRQVTSLLQIDNKSSFFLLKYAHYNYQ